MEKQPSLTVFSHPQRTDPMHACHNCDRLPKRHETLFGMDVHFCPHFRPDDDEEPYGATILGFDLLVETDCIEWKQRRTLYRYIIDYAQKLILTATVLFRKCIKYRSFRR